MHFAKNFISSISCSHFTLLFVPFPETYHVLSHNFKTSEDINFPISNMFRLDKLHFFEVKSANVDILYFKM